MVWLSKSTTIQTTSHPNHQEVECHERDMPKDEKVTEASVDDNHCSSPPSLQFHIIRIQMKETKKWRQREKDRVKGKIGEYTRITRKKDNKKTK